jgi:hypothetical protein
LEYGVKVLQVVVPMEERMETALFSPPLSKQRVEFAIHHINQSHALSLVRDIFFLVLLDWNMQVQNVSQMVFLQLFLTVGVSSLKIEHNWYIE